MCLVDNIFVFLSESDSQSSPELCFVGIQTSNLHIKINNVPVLDNCMLGNEFNTSFPSIAKNLEQLNLHSSYLNTSERNP